MQTRRLKQVNALRPVCHWLCQWSNRCTGKAIGTPPFREQTSRNGLTLLEIVLAIGIFLAATSGILRLTSIGAKASTNARLQSEALMRCESRLAEILAGRAAAKTTDESVFVDDAGWSWQVRVERHSTRIAGDADSIISDYLKTISVTVRRRNSLDEVIALSTLSRIAGCSSGTTAEQYAGGLR